MMAASKARDCDISFTPGFSPVSNDDKKRKTVLNGFLFGHNTEVVDMWRLRRPHGETVETVS
jgi:hypothetical protein